MKKADEIYEEILLDWGGWRRSHRATQGWGGGASFERAGGDRSPGTHSDPVLSEICATLADGQGIYQLIDSRISEFYPAIQRVMIARYVFRATMADIANGLNISVGIARGMHDKTFDELKDSIKYYIKSTKIDRIAIEYGWRIKRAAAA